MKTQQMKIISIINQRLNFRNCAKAISYHSRGILFEKQFGVDSIFTDAHGVDSIFTEMHSLELIQFVQMQKWTITQY